MVQRNPQNILVDGELTAGDQVVTQGVQVLRSGSQVRIADSGGEEDEPPCALAGAEARGGQFRHRAGAGPRGKCEERRLPLRALATAERPAEWTTGTTTANATRTTGPAPRKTAARRASRRQTGTAPPSARRAMLIPAPAKSCPAAPGRLAAGDEPSIADKVKEAARHGGLTALVVRRPILAFVFSTLIVVAGLAAYFGVDVRELPDVDRPVITVRTQYDGAAPETMDREVTRTIEGAVARVAGVDSISSSSSLGRSDVTVEFTQKTDLNVAAADTRDSISRVRNDLPDGIDEPRIIKADANAQAVMRLAVTSDTMRGRRPDRARQRRHLGSPRRRAGRGRRAGLWRHGQGLPRRRRPEQARKPRPDGGRPVERTLDGRLRRPRRHADQQYAGSRRARDGGTADAGRLRAARHRQERPPRRRGDRDAGAGDRDDGAAGQRALRRRPRHRPAGALEHARHLEGRLPGGPRTAADPAEGRQHPRHQRRFRLHQRRHPRGGALAADRRHRRRRDHLSLSARLARDAHSLAHPSRRPRSARWRPSISPASRSTS